MSETRNDNEEALQAGWNRLVVAIGGLILAAGSIVTYAEGRISAGLVETGLSGAALLAARKMKGKEQE